MTRIAIIPARGGSQRIPGKNKRLFHGLPIIAYSIKAAQQASVFDRIIVSTDDDQIAHIAMTCGAWAIHRPEKLCGDEVGTQEVMAQTVNIIPAELACCIYPTAPMIHPLDLQRGLRALEDREDMWFAMGVGAEPLRDAGQFYWGRVKRFLDRAPLIGQHTVMIPLSEKQVCDINTEDDWARAEQMYADLKQA